MLILLWLQFCLNKVSKKRKKPFVKLDMYEMKTWLLVHLDVIILKWKLGNWVILFFSGQKPCFRIISSILHPFLTLFEGYKSYKLYEITPNKRFLWEPKKQTSKASNFTKWNLTHDDFTCVFSIPVKFEIYFLGFP